MPRATVCDRCEQTFFRPRAYRRHLELNRCTSSFVPGEAPSLRDPPPSVNPESPPSGNTRGAPTLAVTPEDQFVLELCAPSSSLTESPLTPATVDNDAVTERPAKEEPATRDVSGALTERSEHEGPAVPPRAKPESVSVAVQADGDWHPAMRARRRMFVPPSPGKRLRLIDRPGTPDHHGGELSSCVPGRGQMCDCVRCVAHMISLCEAEHR